MSAEDLVKCIMDEKFLTLKNLLYEDMDVIVDYVLELRRLMVDYLLTKEESYHAHLKKYTALDDYECVIRTREKLPLSEEAEALAAQVKTNIIREQYRIRTFKKNAIFKTGEIVGAKNKRGRWYAAKILHIIRIREPRDFMYIVEFLGMSSSKIEVIRASEKRIRKYKEHRHRIYCVSNSFEELKERIEMKKMEKQGRVKLGIDVLQFGSYIEEIDDDEGDLTDELSE